MIYTRITNPTVAQLSAKIVALEGGMLGTCTSSGHAAQLTALYALMHPGDKVIASKCMYGGTMTQLSRTILKVSSNSTKLGVPFCHRLFHQQCVC